MTELLKLATLENEFEAQVLSDVLRERGVDVFIKPYRDAAYDMVLTAGWGWGGVYGNAEQGAEICALLEEIRSGVAR